MTIEALETMVQSANSSYIPVGIQHDPRIAPVGRVASASIRKFDDGEYGVEGIIEFFERGDKFELDANQRTLVTKKYESGRLEIEYDRNFRNTEDQLLIEKIAGLFGTRPIENVKKALDPITVLTIGGAFILGGVAQGFLSKLGENTYEVLKQGLKKLFARKKTGEDEKLLMFRAVVFSGKNEVETMIILTNPSGEDIDDLVDLGLSELDKAVRACWDPKSGLRRLVFEYSDKHLILKFGVRKDAVPLYPKSVGDIETDR